MKIAIVIAAFVCCAAAQTTRGPQPTRSATEVKSELIKRAEDLKTRVAAEIQKLTEEKREHLSQLLKEEEQRVERLVGQLKEATDPVQLAVLESELIDAEYRVDNEVNILQRETATQDLLIESAKVLKEWVTEEIKNLESQSGNRPHEVARLLRREEQNLESIAQRLVQAKDQRQIETLEVALRAVEVRLYEALRALHFQPPTEAPRTTVAVETTPAETKAPVTTEAPVTSEAPVTTGAPVTTEGPVTTGAPVSTRGPETTETPVETDSPTGKPTETDAAVTGTTAN